MESRSNLTLTVIRPIDQAHDDQLVHKFCTLCLRADEIRGVKIKPYCGKQKPTDWVPANPADPICVVCTEMVKNPCPRCGEVKGQD